MKKKSIISILLTVLLLNVFSLFPVFAQDEANERNGIVEVITRAEDSSGNIYKEKSCEGFIVRKESGYAYIVTLRTETVYSRNTLKKLEKQNNLMENSLHTSVYVYTYRDSKILVNKRIVTKDLNIAILQIENAIDTKCALSLSSNDEIYEGDRIYALGFYPTKVGVEGTEYNSNNVDSKTGQVIQKNKDDMVTNISYELGFRGAPVFDLDNYVVGMMVPGDANNSNKVILVDQIREFLDNQGISYEKKAYDTSKEQLEKLVEEYTPYATDKSYTKDSRKELQVAIDNANKLLNPDGYNGQPTQEQFNDAAKAIREAKDKLEKGQSILVIVRFIAFGACIPMVVLVLKNIITIKKIKDDISHIQNDLGSLNYQQNHKEKEQGVNPIRKKSSISRLIHDKSSSSLELTRTIQIGKKDGVNDFIIVGNKTVSSIHCCIEKQDDSYLIKDLNSTNGTFVNGKRIDGNGCVLNDGDEIRLGTEILHYRKEYN